MSKILKNSNGKVVLDNVNANIIVSAGGQPTPTGETWVLNSNYSSCFLPYVEGTSSSSVQITGTFCDLSFTQLLFEFDTVEGNIAQISDNVEFSNTFIISPSNKRYMQLGGTDNKTFVFSTAPTGDLLTWLQANAVKQ